MNEDYGSIVSLTLGASVMLAWAVYSCSLWASIFIGGLTFAIVELWQRGQA